MHSKLVTDGNLYLLIRWLRSQWVNTCTSSTVHAKQEISLIKSHNCKSNETQKKSQSNYLSFIDNHKSTKKQLCLVMCRCIAHWGAMMVALTRTVVDRSDELVLRSLDTSSASFSSGPGSTICGMGGWKIIGPWLFPIRPSAPNAGFMSTLPLWICTHGRTETKS